MQFFMREITYEDVNLSMCVFRILLCAGVLSWI